MSRTAFRDLVWLALLLGAVVGFSQVIRHAGEPEWARCLDIAERYGEPKHHLWEVICAQMYLVEIDAVDEGDPTYEL